MFYFFSTILTLGLSLVRNITRGCFLQFSDGKSCYSETTLDDPTETFYGDFFGKFFAGFFSVFWRIFLVDFLYGFLLINKKKVLILYDNKIRVPF